MRYETAKVSKGGKGIRSFQMEQFESIEEAIQVLGEKQALLFINYAHGLSQRAKIYRET